jgi:hypothetical protein
MDKKDQQINAICGPSKAKHAGHSTNKEKIKHQNRSIYLLASAIEPNKKQRATMALDHARPAFAEIGKASA